jgi:adenine phosphoribosyltransferase
MESRGFIFAPPVAYRLKAGFVPVRKPGKLPWKTKTISYDLEYGKDALEIHQDAIQPGQRVLILDDVIATGGTAAATIKLAREMGAEVVGAAFLIELTFLQGRKKISDAAFFSILQY